MQANAITANRVRLVALVTTGLVLVSSAAPALALTLAASEPLAVPAASPDDAAGMGLAYAHQLAFLQNPILDPGFEVGFPAWSSAGGSIVAGALVLEPGDGMSQSFPAATDAGFGAFGAYGPFVNAEALAFRALGNGTVSLQYVEQATGQVFSVLSASFTDADGVLHFDIPQTPRLAQSSPYRLSFMGSAPGGATVDDVVLQGVEYGDATLPVQLDDPLPRDAQHALNTLQNVLDDEGVPLDLQAAVESADHAHDGYSLLVLPLDFTPAAGGVNGLLASPADFVQQPGTWRFAVYLAEYGPSGTRLLDADSLADARLLLNITPTLSAEGEPAAPRQLLALSDTPYADLASLEGLDGRGVVFRTGEIALESLNLVAVWSTPADEGGLYHHDDVRGFFHPAKLALGALPVADALDVVSAPLAAFGVGAVPCQGADGLTFRFGDLDCDGEGDAAEVQCNVVLDQGVGVSFFTPDPLDARTNCSDPDGDGLIGEYDPQPNVAGSLTVTIQPDANGDWWTGLRALDFTIDNSFNGENGDTTLTIDTAVIFQTSEEVDFDGERVECDGADIITSDETVSGTCYFDTGVATEAADYRVILIAEILQPPYAAPVFGDDLGRLVGLDHTAPADTTLDVTGTPGLAGWHVSPVDVAFVASDALSGVMRVDCAIGSAAFASCASLRIDAPGQTDLRYRAVDAAGNLETTKMRSFFLSLNDPVVACAPTTAPAGENGWHLGSILVACSAASDPSDHTIEVALDDDAIAPYDGPISIDAAGAHVVLASATDVAGRTSGVSAFDAPVDLAPPMTTLDIDAVPIAGSLYDSALSIGFDVADDASGLDHTLVSVNGAAPQAFAPGERLELTLDGTYDLAYQSVDGAGRVETLRERTIAIDRTAPDTFSSITGTLGLNGWYRSDLLVELSATDDTSGIASIEYVLDGAGPFPYPEGGISVVGDGHHELRYFGVDEAGNVETEHVLPLDIDATPPVVALTFEGMPGLGGWHLGSVVGNVSASDATSGLASVLYLQGGSDFQSYAGNFTVSAQGLTAVSAYATDLAGNAAPIQSTQIKIDNVDPVTTATLSGPEVSNGWFDGDVEVALSASDAVSGVSRIDYSLDGSAFTTYTGPITVTGDLDHVLLTRAYDVAGNAEDDQLVAVRIDTTPPAATTLDVTGTLGNDGWYTTDPVLVTLTPSDATSGVQLLRVSTDGGVSHTTYAGDQPTALLLGGTRTYSLAFHSRDMAGHDEPGQSATLKIDGEAPKSRGLVSGLSVKQPWINEGLATLTLMADDQATGSGVAMIEYRIDGGDWTAYTAPIEFDTDGVFLVDHRAIDVAGNVEAFQTTTVQRDTTAPDVTGEPHAAPGPSGWYNAAILFFVNGTDATSQIDRVEYRIDDGDWTGVLPDTVFVFGEQGTSTIHFRAIDQAGNVGAEGSHTLMIDALTPTTSVALAGTEGSNDHFTSAVTVTLSNVSGPSGATTEYRLGDDAAQPYTGAFSLDTQGTHVVGFRSVSVSGLEEDWQERTVLIDLEDPVTQASIVQDVIEGSTYSRTPATITLAATDSFSGVVLVETSLDGVAFDDYVDPIVVSDLGETTVHFRATDAAGRVEATQSVTVRVDTLPPTTTASLDGAAGNAGWFRGPVDVTLSATAGPSGVASTSYAIDDGATQSYAAPFTISADGEYDVSFASRSVAGIDETPGSVDVKVDATAPVTTITPSGSQVDPDYYTSLVTINLTATDATSGVALIEYRVNGGNWTAYGGDFTPAVTGEVTVDFRATDVAGNLEAFQTATYVVDDEVPVSTLVLDGTLGANDWYRSSVTATLTATGGPSGVDRIEYADNGDAFATYGGPVTIAGQGEHDFVHRAVSNAGLVETDRNAAFKIDTVAPVTTIEIGGTLGSAGYYTSDVSVFLNATDATSGLWRVHYQLDGGDWTLYTGAIPVAASGTHTIIVQATDLAGNVETTHERTFSLDVDEILTHISANGTRGDAGWFIGPVEITLAPEGGPSGIASTEVSLDSGAFGESPLTFEIADDGEHVVAARSTNGAGVLESPPKILGVDIDTIAPTVSHDATPPGGEDGWYVAGFVLTVTATDATSEVRLIQYRHDGGQWLNFSNAEHLPEMKYTTILGGHGTHTFEYRAFDRAGHVSEVGLFEYKVDAAAPVTTFALAGDAGDDGWNTTSATLTLSATAGPSDVAGIYYAIDGGDVQLYQDALVFADGVYDVTFNATSGAGIHETAQPLTIKVDTLAPATTIELGGSETAGWFVEPVTVFLNATDATSLVALVEVSVDGGEFTPYTAPFLVSAEGATTIDVRATDFAGNVEVAHTASFQIDTVGPRVDVSVDGTSVTPDWFVDSPTVNVSATDAMPGSGVASILLDGAPTGSSFVVDGDGVFIYSFHATDVAGNVGPTFVQLVLVDRIVPTTTATVDALAGENGWVRSIPEITLDATFGPSQGLATRYSVDGGQTQEYDLPFSILGEGDHTIVFASESIAGLIEPDQTIEVRVDSAPPLSILGLAGMEGANGWYTSPVDVSFASFDATSGVVSCEYSLDGAPFEPTTDFTLSADGQHTIAHRCTDAAGNVGALATQDVWIDTIDPTISGAITAGTLGDAGYYVTPVTVALTTDDEHSGVSRILASRNGGAFEEVGASVVIDAQGATNLSYRVEDASGRTSAVGSLDVTIDSILPAVDIVLAGTLGDDGWYTSAVDASVVATDAGSGIATRAYSLDGSADFPCGCPVTVSANGEHTINATARDAAGNVGTKKDVRVKIDTVPPTTVASVSGTQGQNDWFIGPVTVAFSVSDDLSGLRHVLVSIDNGEYAPASGSIVIGSDGSHVVKFYGVDSAGNEEPVQTRTFKIDTTAPVPTRSLGGTMGSGGWFTTPVTVTLGAADGGSNVGQIRYKLNDGNEQTYTGPFQIASEGATTLRYRAIDNAGISSATLMETIRVDTRAPSTTNATSGDKGANGWFTTDVTVTLAGSDPAPGSGVASTSYALDGAPSQGYTTPFTVSGEGAHVVTFASTDNAGLAGATRTLRFSIDSEAPSVDIALMPVAASTYTTPVQVSISAADATSGIASIEYSLDGATWLAYAGPLTFDTSGDHSVYARATDKAGLGSDQAFEAFTVDVDVPTLATTTYRENVPTATPTVEARFGPVFAGWNAASASVLVDGSPAPHCVASEDAGALVVSCTPIAWTEAFALGAHSVLACATTDAGKEWCSDDLLVRSGGLPWTFTITADDWDRDGHPNNRETRYGSLPFHPYSVPYDPQGWNLRTTPNDPTSPEVASDSQNLSLAQSFVKIHFDRYAYASDPAASFAPDRTAVVATLDRIAIMEPVATTSPTIGVRAGANELASVSLGDSTTTVTVAGTPVEIPARAYVVYEQGDTTGSFGIELRALEQTLARIGVAEGAELTVTLYDLDGEPVASYPPVDSDGDNFTDELEGLLGSDPGDGQDTPVPRSDTADDYAVVIQPLGPVAPGAGAEGVSQTVALFSSSGTFSMRVHVDDFPAGGRASLDGQRLRFALLPANAAQAYLPSTDGIDTGGLSPAGRDPTAYAHWSLDCTIGVDCDGVRYEDGGDDTRIVVDVPSDRAAIGPYLIWAHVDLPDRGGVDSASGFYAAPKALLHDAPVENDETMLVEEEQDYTATPVVFVTIPKGDALGEDGDGDGYTTAQELGFDQSRGSGSDPFDVTSTPEGDDDGDGCLNMDEEIPSWILATPGGCAALPEEEVS